MESVNVLGTGTIGDPYSQRVISPRIEECAQMITSVSPRIKLTDGADLLRAEGSGDLASKKKLDVLLAEAEVIYAYRLPTNVIARSPKLKWVHLWSAGLNHLLNTDIMRSQVILTNGRGIYDTPIAEFVLGLMLMFVKNMALYTQLKQEKQWKRFPLSLLHSKTVGIVGLGNTGRGVARLAKSFGMRVVGVDIKRAARTRYVDISLPREQLPQLLSDSDFVVLTLPLTSETSRLIGEKELRTMKPSAYLINTARGGLVDEETLIRALEEHWIAGAGLDCFANEQPLPTDSKLWELPNAIITPDVSGSTLEDYAIRATELFCENLRRYLSEKRLLNVVDKKKGY